MTIIMAAGDDVAQTGPLPDGLAQLTPLRVVTAQKALDRN